VAVTDILAWPTSILKPAAIEPNVVAFSRSGGRTLGGLERVTRTDRGFWSIVYRGVPLATPAQRRLWNAVAQHCGGAAGLLEVPVWSFDSAAWPAGAVDGKSLVPHSDGSGFSDGTFYAQPSIGVTLVSAVAIGATSVTLRIGYGIEELSGVRFSYQGALYRTGLSTAISGTDWTVPISPAIRAPIPAGAALEFGLPTCIVRLAGDREMDVIFSRGGVDRRDVAFVEAADYWNDLAAEEEA
jgi:hypothetical protein